MIAFSSRVSRSIYQLKLRVLLRVLSLLLSHLVTLPYLRNGKSKAATERGLLRQISQ